MSIITPQPSAIFMNNPEKGWKKIDLCTSKKSYRKIDIEIISYKPISVRPDF